MRRQYRKYAVWGAAFVVLITLGAATAAFTAGAAPFGAEATTTIVTTITTGSSTVVTHDHDDHAGLHVELDRDGHDVHRHDDHHGHEWQRFGRRWNCAGCDADEGGAEVHGLAVGDCASS